MIFILLKAGLNFLWYQMDSDNGDAVTKGNLSHRIPNIRGINMQPSQEYITVTTVSFPQEEMLTQG